MPRYIDAEKIWYRNIGNRLMADREEINRMIPVDVAPVIHARWIADPEDPFDGLCICSNPKCDCKIWDMDADFALYCPRCGAKMDERDC